MTESEYMTMENRLDRRRKYYMILDCETATLPLAADYDGAARKNIAIAKPLIYDLGWTICDNKGNVYRSRKFLITEIFSVPAVFNTAYYASKRPLYLDRLAKGETTLKTWAEATAVLEEDLQEVQAVGAYNSMFDFKKAIPFTELYIKELYSPDYFKWEESQRKTCDSIASGKKFEGRDFDGEHFRFRNKVYNLFDVWGLSCRHVLNNDKYRKACLENGWVTESGKYFKTSAEVAFRFLTGETDFEEAHMAIDDAEIETQIFAKVHKKTKGKWEMGIIYFPFREIGKVSDF